MDISSLRERQSSAAMTVSELNNLIKTMFDGNRFLSSVTLKGEISNFTNHRSGHLYFSIKDATSQIKAVMFRSSAAGLKFMPENGMKVIVHGAVSVFARDGAYQIYVTSLQPDGIGALYLAYEQLKERLAGEGLFDSETKKHIPIFPESIGVITSPTGAAVRDIINVIGRRFPLCKIYLYPALVQGDGAEDSLCKALQYFNDSKLVDTVIIGRGGGSIEDLWAFNSEKLARLIYSSDVPVISAVGHETDFTICDFVADLRAPTPSAAAELAVPDTRELMQRIDIFSDRIDAALVGMVENGFVRLEKVSENIFLKNPDLFFGKYDEAIEDLTDRLKRCIGDLTVFKENHLSSLLGRLNALNPLMVLSRGFSVVEKEGKILSSVKSVKSGDEIRIRLSDGELNALVGAENGDKEYEK